MKTRKYSITVGRAGEVTHPEVEGFPLGAHVALRYCTLGDSAWVVDHIPTGLKFGAFRSKTLCRAVARDVERRTGDKLRTTDPGEVVKALGGELCGQWLARVSVENEFVSYESFLLWNFANLQAMEGSK